MYSSPSRMETPRRTNVSPRRASLRRCRRSLGAALELDGGSPILARDTAAFSVSCRSQLGYPKRAPRRRALMRGSESLISLMHRADALAAPRRSFEMGLGHSRAEFIDTTSFSIRRSRTSELFASSIAATCLRLRPNGRRSKASRALGSELRALARSGGSGTTLGASSSSRSISTTSPSMIPAAARLAALIPTRRRPRISATRLRHVWPPMVMAIGGRACGLRTAITCGGISTAVAFPDGMTVATNFTCSPFEVAGPGGARRHSYGAVERLCVSFVNTSRTAAIDPVRKK